MGQWFEQTHHQRRQWPTNTLWKDAQGHWSSRKWKLKPQQGITPYRNENERNGQHQKLARMWSPKSLAHCMWEQKKYNRFIEISVVDSCGIEHKCALSKSSPRYLPKRSENICLWEGLYQNVHSNFIIAPNWQQSKCSLAREMINRLLFIHTMECVSAIERNKPLMDCEDIWRAKKPRHLHTVQFQVYEVQVQAMVIDGERDQNGGCLWE